MVAQPVEDFLTAEFVAQAAATLAASGLVTDEHDFAPYRETVSERVEAIERALLAAGHHYELLPGFVEHPQAGYAYFIYDAKRFTDREAADSAVLAWLDERYR
ncbi:hypothetical protein TomTYG45_03150 [Sphingobium sp. TomTYG45]|jgi:hypothetical protein